MRRVNSIIAFLIISLLLFTLTACSTGNSSAGAPGNSDAEQTEDTGESKATDNKDNNSDSSDSESSGSVKTGTASKELRQAMKEHDEKRESGEILPSFMERYSEEEREKMGNITGTWEYKAPLPDGNTSVVRAKIDNIGGMTLTTGVMDPSGKGSFYSHVGSYEVTSDNVIIFNASTGGESSDGESYELRQDPANFQYAFAVNPELTQLTLTAQNEAARQLTGEAPIVLTKY